MSNSSTVRQVRRTRTCSTLRQGQVRFVRDLRCWFIGMLDSQLKVGKIAHVDAGRGSSGERDDGGLGAPFRFFLYQILYRDMYRRSGADDDVAVVNPRADTLGVAAEPGSPSPQPRREQKRTSTMTIEQERFNEDFNCPKKSV